MPLSPEDWNRLAAPTVPDLLALRTVEDSLPVHWLQMSPEQLMNGAAVIAMRYDRKRMAEALRDRILHKQPTPDEVRIRAALPDPLREAFDYLVGRFEVTLFEVAEQLEQGTLGTNRTT